MSVLYNKNKIEQRFLKEDLLEKYLMKNILIKKLNLEAQEYKKL